VTRRGALIATLKPGTTYFFETDDNAAGADNAKTAGKTEGKPQDPYGPMNPPPAKTGMSSAVKWGIVAGAGATAVGVPLGLHLANSASR